MSPQKGSSTKTTFFYVHKTNATLNGQIVGNLLIKGETGGPTEEVIRMLVEGVNQEPYHRVKRTTGRVYRKPGGQGGKGQPVTVWVGTNAKAKQTTNLALLMDYAKMVRSEVPGFPVDERPGKRETLEAVAEVVTQMPSHMLIKFERTLRRVFSRNRSVEAALMWAREELGIETPREDALLAEPPTATAVRDSADIQRRGRSRELATDTCGNGRLDRREMSEERFLDELANHADRGVAQVERFIFGRHGERCLSVPGCLVKADGVEVSLGILDRVRAKLATVDRMGDDERATVLRFFSTGREAGP